MVRRPLNPPAAGTSLTLREREWEILAAHLFRDGDEHGAVILAEVSAGPRGLRLLGRQVVLARDGVDYVPGRYGYRALHSDFVRDQAVLAREAGLAYIAVHNHQGGIRVAFSRVDLASHERGYPALLEIVDNIVGGLVCTPLAASGDVWLPGGGRENLAELVVAGHVIRRLRPTPHYSNGVEGLYERQALLFGSAGQECFREMRVAIVGQGGAGSILSEQLARLGVGHFTLVDDDVVDVTNLPRLVGSVRSDVGMPKVEVGRDVILKANPDASVLALQLRMEDLGAREAVGQVDHIFLAADGNGARHWVNAIVERSLIPGVQVGVKVPVSDSGDVGMIHSVVRPLVPGLGCLWCNALIDPTELAIDLQPDSEARRQARYVSGVDAPSVMSLNSLAVSMAVTDFMLGVTDLLATTNGEYRLEFPRGRVTESIVRRRSASCPWCGDAQATTVPIDQQL